VEALTDPYYRLDPGSLLVDLCWKRSPKEDGRLRDCSMKRSKYIYISSFSDFFSSDFFSRLVFQLSSSLFTLYSATFVLANSGL
jgi:hypothetical protein